MYELCSLAGVYCTSGKQISPTTTTKQITAGLFDVASQIWPRGIIQQDTAFKDHSVEHTKQIIIDKRYSNKIAKLYYITINVTVVNIYNDLQLRHPQIHRAKGSSHRLHSWKSHWRWELFLQFRIHHNARY